MMNALQLSKRMREAGMAQGEAEALAQAVDEYMHENAASKGDIEALRVDLRASVSELKQHTWQTCLTVCGAVGVLQVGAIYALMLRLGGH
jgi:hypothetical protein